jgi:hypothetical protein
MGGSLVIPHIAGAQQGLKGGGLGWGCPGELWDQLWAGVLHVQVAGILVVVDLAAQQRGRYPSMVWVWRLEASVAEGWVSWWCVDPPQPERQGSHCVLVWFWAVAWCSSRGREPCRTSGSADLRGRNLAGRLFFY